MERSERVKLLKQMHKNAILEHSRHDISWYLNRMEALTNSDLSDPVVQNELKTITNIVVNRFEEMKEESAQEKKPRPIGFRMSDFSQKTILKLAYNASQSQAACQEYYQKFLPIANRVMTLSQKKPQVTNELLTQIKNDTTQLITATNMLLGKKVISQHASSNLRESIGALTRINGKFSVNSFAEQLDIFVNIIRNINAVINNEQTLNQEKLRTPQQAQQAKIQEQLEEYEGMYQLYHDPKAKQDPATMEKNWNSWLKENPKLVKIYKQYGQNRTK